MFLFSLLLFVLPLHVKSEFVCPSRPVLLKSTYTFAPDVVLAGNCTFIVTYEPESIFNSTFALVGVTVDSVDTKGNESVTITDAFGSVFDATTLPDSISFPPPCLTISIIANANSKMNLIINIYETKFSPFSTLQRNGFHSVDTNNLGQALVIKKMEAKTYTLVYSQHNKELLAVAAPEGPASAVLMNAFVYDGFNTTDAKLVGTLYSIAQKGPIFSTSNKFTVYCTQAITLDGIAWFTDNTNTQQYPNYSVMWATPTADVYHTVELSAENGAATISIWGNADYSNTIYVDKIDLSTADTKVLAYAQVPLADINKMYLMAEYTKDNVIAALPQHFDSYVRTFVVNKGKAKIRFTTDANQAQITKPTDGRMGFIASQDFGRMSKNLKSNEFKLRGTEDFTVTFEIAYSSQKAAMEIRNLDDHAQDLGVTMPLTVEIPFQYSARNIDVSINAPGDQPDGGSFVYYSIKSGRTTRNPKPDNGGNTKSPSVETTTKGVNTVSLLVPLIATVFKVFSPLI